MAKHATDHLSYFLKIAIANKEHLANIRAWDNLKVASAGDSYWVTNFTVKQIHSVEVKQIPYKEIFYLKGNQLYPMDSLLPSMAEPKLLFTPIQKAFPLTIAKENHNYFGLQEKISVHVVSANEEQKATALLTSYTELKAYIQTAPNFRLKVLRWVLINDDEVMIFGDPLLPIQGVAYWQNDNHLLPVGYNFDLPILAADFAYHVDESNFNWIIWNTDFTYFLLEKSKLMPLSRTSFRRSKEKEVDQ